MKPFEEVIAASCAHTGCTHDRLVTLGTSEDGLEEEYKCLDCGRVLSTLEEEK